MKKLTILASAAALAATFAAGWVADRRRGRP